MPVLDDTLIQSLVRQLDDAIPRQGHVEVLVDPEEPDDRLVRANRLGYLRLGVAFLKAAYDAPRTVRGQECVDVDIDYLTGLGECRYWFERREDVWSPISPEPPDGVWSNLAGGLCGLIAIGVLVIGVLTILQWLTSAIS